MLTTIIIYETGIVLLPTMLYGYALSGHLITHYDETNAEVVTILEITTLPVEMQLDKEEIVKDTPEIKDFNNLWDLGRYSRHSN